MESTDVHSPAQTFELKREIGNVREHNDRTCMC